MHRYTTVFKQPRAFYLVWLIELWERFGFYGMQAILVLYLVRELGFSDAHAYSTFGAFGALLYAFTSIGGFIGDKIIGTKRTILFGAIVLCLGYLLLSISNETNVFFGLGVIAVGNALFKANPSSLLAKLYKQDDPGIDGAFTLYYMSINVGSFISISATPFIAKFYDWHIAFFISCLGLFLGIINYIALLHWAKEFGSRPDFEPLSISKTLIIIISVIILSFISSWLLQNLTLAHIILIIAGIVVTSLFLREIYLAKGQDRANLIACLILIIQAIVFFSLYQQMPTSLNLFAVRNVEPYIFGIQIVPAAFQALNPFWIIIASPILAYIYGELGKKGKDLSLPGKFTTGMFFCSFAFLLLFSSVYFTNNEGVISANWLIASYLLLSIGELLVSGLGGAMIARLCPHQLMGFMMSIWFMSTAISMVIGGQIASLASIPNNITDPIYSLTIYTDLFRDIGLVTLLISLIMLLFVPGLKKLCLKENC